MPSCGRSLAGTPVPGHDGGVENLATAGTALIVVDMQEYFCRPDSVTSRFVAAVAQDDGQWYQQRLATVIPNIARLIVTFRASELPIVYTEFGSHEPDGSDMPYFARRHNDWATQQIGDRCYRPLAEPSSRVIRELAPAASDMVVQKVTSGPLAGTEIADRLRNVGVRTVIVTGIMTDACVTGMARELADSNFSATVVADACAAAEEGAHVSGLRCLRNFAAIRDTEDVVVGLAHTTAVN